MEFSSNFLPDLILVEALLQSCGSGVGKELSYERAGC